MVNLHSRHTLATQTSIRAKHILAHFYEPNQQSMLPVHKVMEDKANQTIWSVGPQHMVIEALELMAEKNIGAVLVMDGEQLLGIFSERDYARKGIIKGRKAKSTPVTEVMTSKLFTITPEMGIRECMNLMSTKRIRHLPVIQDDKVTGLLSIGDIVNAIILEQRSHIKFLEQYISGT